MKLVLCRERMPPTVFECGLHVALQGSYCDRVDVDELLSCERDANEFVIAE
jgi:hypothetical protein